ncbi:MAG: CBS domain-containing protein [Spirochaetes bacterium]|jgi:CBS domain-containing protein|nr:CBS domain-containing protein [Spirochaetota bacterium]
MRLYMESTFTATKDKIKDTLTIKENQSIQELITLFTENRLIQQVYVINNEGSLIGKIEASAVTEMIYFYSNLNNIKAIRSKQLKLKNRNVSYFVKQVESASINDDLLDVYYRMNNKKTSFMPVVDSKNRPQGIIAINDILKYMNK